METPAKPQHRLVWLTMDLVIDPARVESVEFNEGEGGVTVITMQSGARHVVTDDRIGERLTDLLIGAPSVCDAHKPNPFVVEVAA